LWLQESGWDLILALWSFSFVDTLLHKSGTSVNNTDQKMKRVMMIVLDRFFFNAQSSLPGAALKESNFYRKMLQS